MEFKDEGVKKRQGARGKGQETHISGAEGIYELSDQNAIKVVYGKQTMRNASLIRAESVASVEPDLPQRSPHAKALSLNFAFQTTLITPLDI